MAQNTNGHSKFGACVLCSCCCPDSPRMTAKHESVLEAQQAPLKTENVLFAVDLPKDLKVGDVICITGLIPSNCMKFSVDLTCGRVPNANPDIAFHFNPRLDQNYVVRNCRLGGHWGEEETASIVKCDFPRNKKFEIAVFIGKDEFMVSVNGRHFCAFRFRIPLTHITRVELHGQVEMCNVEHKEWKTYPQVDILDVPYARTMGEGETSDTQQLWAVPFTGALSKGFSEGWQLEIYGRIKLLPHSFYINLQEGSQLWPHPRIPLHLNPRFNTTMGQNVVIRNAWVNGTWGAEERGPGFQFSPGSPFSMIIRRDTNYFSVWVDGQLTGEFKFRGPIDKIDTVCIQGDIFLKDIFMNERITDLYTTRNTNKS